ncbi:LOW QUALITY PROTEIN: hypothetical protein Cgig2_030930 [Carnegiea gigantea]|uniref:Uncharacterized protein n=1 Tax=Carnegiea gigantea TaxID=171969 RepID=A0A9Q1QIQ2_9CARY|nr:LOW QUALITY PROTEIN: hypothetical protein Cgig2_030930 [Carnegiea gigantea]
MLRRCDKFKNWIKNNSFIVYGHKFTWVKENNEATQKCARLDRALCNVESRTQFHEGSHLLYNYADPLPLLISTCGFAQLLRSPNPFRFQVVWTTHEGFGKKSRVEAIRDGNRNTRYFHMNTVIHWKFNLIEVLQYDEGEWVTVPNETKLKHFGCRNLKLRLFEVEIAILNIFTRAPSYARKSPSIFIGGDGFGKENPLSPMGTSHAAQIIRRPLDSNDESLEWSLRMLLEPNKIWARVLAFKYCGGGNLLHSYTPHPKSRHSNAWRGLWEQRRHIETNAGMALGNRHLTRFWLNHWAQPSPLLIFATQYVPLFELEKLVYEYWDERGVWKWDAFFDFLPHPMLSASFKKNL